MEQKIDRSLALRPSSELSKSSGENRILGEIVLDSLAVANDEESELEKLNATVCKARQIQDKVPGMTSNNIKAFELLLHAALVGHAEAQYELAVCFDFGVGTEYDSLKSTYWMRCAANQGLAEAQHKIGNQLGNEGKLVEAVGWYRKAAEQGHPASQDILGRYYATGEGVPQNNIAAYAWARLAAGAPDCQSALSASGWGGPDYSQEHASAIAAILSPSHLKMAELLYLIFKQQYSEKY